MCYLWIHNYIYDTSKVSVCVIVSALLQPLLLHNYESDVWSSISATVHNSEIGNNGDLVEQVA